MPKYVATPLSGWTGDCKKEVAITPPPLRCATAGDCTRTWTYPTAAGGLHVVYGHPAGQLPNHYPVGFRIRMPVGAGVVSGGVWKATLNITDNRGNADALPIQSDQPPDNCTGRLVVRRLVYDRAAGRRRQRLLRRAS